MPSKGAYIWYQAPLLLADVIIRDDVCVMIVSSHQIAIYPHFRAPRFRREWPQKTALV
jgi:hypothetical protein